MHHGYFHHWSRLQVIFAKITLSLLESYFRQTVVKLFSQNTYLCLGDWQTLESYFYQYRNANEVIFARPRWGYFRENNLSFSTLIFASLLLFSLKFLKLVSWTLASVIVFSPDHNVVIFAKIASHIEIGECYFRHTTQWDYFRHLDDRKM